MNKVLSLVLVGCALGLTGFSGWWQGRMTNRWGPPISMLEAAERLEQLPEQIGNWELSTQHAPLESVVKMLQCEGYLHRTYVNVETGAAVSIAIILGPPGPTAVHTPEICYNSRAFDVQSQRTVASVSAPDGSHNEFWFIDLESRRATDDSQRVYYAWSTGRVWLASESPRLAFRSSPYLYKIQLACPKESKESTDEGLQFLQAFVAATSEFFVPTPT